MHRAKWVAKEGFKIASSPNKHSPVKMAAWESRTPKKPGEDMYLGDKGTVNRLIGLNRVAPLTPTPQFESMARGDRMFTPPAPQSLLARQSLHAQVTMMKVAKGNAKDDLGQAECGELTRTKSDSIEHMQRSSTYSERTNALSPKVAVEKARPFMGDASQPATG